AKRAAWYMGVWFFPKRKPDRSACCSLLASAVPETSPDEGFTMFVREVSSIRFRYCWRAAVYSAACLGDRLWPRRSSTWLLTWYRASPQSRSPPGLDICLYAARPSLL